MVQVKIRAFNLNFLHPSSALYHKITACEVFHLLSENFTVSISVFPEAHPALGANFCFENSVLSLYPLLLYSTGAEPSSGTEVLSVSPRVFSCTSSLGAMPGVKNLQERELSSLQQYQAGSKTQQSNKQIKRKNPV